MYDIGLRIKDLRTQNNLTQVDFCTVLGIKQANLSHIENSGKKISIEILYKIISNFNINANWLLSGEGDIYKTTNTDMRIKGDNNINSIGNNNVNGNMHFKTGALTTPITINGKDFKALMENCGKECEVLKFQVESLKAQLQMKDEIIELLKKQSK
jgi:transcriptional regulator with XRE-family HTH domain